MRNFRIENEGVSGVGVGLREGAVVTMGVSGVNRGPGGLPPSRHSPELEGLLTGLLSIKRPAQG